MRTPRQRLILLLGTQLRAILLVGALLGCGMGAVLVQTFGWLTMIPTQLVETGSVTQAVENTFDGEHPCEFCKTAEKLREIDASPVGDRESPKKAPPKKWHPKLLVASLNKIQAPSPDSSFRKRLTDRNQRPSSFEQEPACPPPQTC